MDNENKDDEVMVRLDTSAIVEMFSKLPDCPKYFNSTSLVSPFDLTIRENRLAELKRVNDLGEPTPCDLLLFGYDDDNGRTHTKVGGLPYWPTSRTWPVSDDGYPLEFLTQFNFTESTDILPSLPAELMSVFVRQHRFEMCLFHVVWHFIDESTPLISGHDIPEVEEPLVKTPAFGVPCRVMDYPDADCSRATVDEDDFTSIAVSCGSKIGGTPSFFGKSKPKTTGDFICALHSLRHPTNVAWPFLNVESPLTPEMLGGIGCNGGRGCHDTVMFDDLGALYFFLQTNGEVRILLQSWSCEEFLNVRC